MIGYQEDNGGGAWTHLRVIRAGTPVVNGARAEVPVVERHLHRSGGAPNVTLHDVIQLEYVNGRWTIAKLGYAFYEAIGAYQSRERDVPARYPPVRVPAGVHPPSAALRSDGTVVVWGSYFTGVAYVPATPILGLSNVIAIAAGSDHDLALLGHALGNAGSGP